MARNTSGARDIAIVLFYLVALFLVTGIAWRLTLPPPPRSVDDWKNFGVTATIGITGVSAVMTAWIAIRNFRAQTRAALRLEQAKHVLEERIPAHARLFAAASNYYRALAPLETGRFSLDAIEDAETKMKEVEGLILYVSKDFAEHWRIFWQHCRHAREQVSAHIPDVEARRIFWASTAKLLGEDLRTLETIARQYFET